MKDAEDDAHIIAMSGRGSLHFLPYSKRFNKGKSTSNSERKGLLPKRDGYRLINNTFHYICGLEALYKVI